MSAKAKNAQTFEEAISALEKITKSLENGSASLEQSLGFYEEGIKLIKHCNKLLDDAERRVKILGRSNDGKVEETDFSVE